MIATEKAAARGANRRPNFVKGLSFRGISSIEDAAEDLAQEVPCCCMRSTRT